jgi:hypothetical protein
MGSVRDGIDRGVTERLLEDPVDERPACGACWARWFCGGGCHHENLITSGGLGDPNPVTCEILRHGMDLTLETWARLSQEGRLGGRSPVAAAPRSHSMSEAGRAWSDGDRPVRRADCHARDLPPKEGRSERVVYVPETHEVVVLNPTASAIFDLCDGRNDVAAILAALEKRFRAPAGVLRSDLLRTLAEFRGKGLIL